ncbi:MAG: adenylyl-sulfate kinase, partial [Chloroflexi bacterium]|nr:adenylyl-sulfate kinase [Chloroflexota bacterium]
MADRSLPGHIQAMLSPDAYPHPVDGVELLQTHISYLFFAGEFVYKVKKPLDLGFLVFTALEQRHHFCQEELRLNRRLCSETYLDVVPIVFADGEAKVDAEGAAIDYAVKMRRLPEEGMMTRLLERDAVTPELLARLAQRIAGFHA